MSRILIAWELGAGLGHALRLMPLAKELQTRGHEVVLCLQDFWRCASRLEDCVLPLLQAPLYQASVSGLPEPPLSFAEILHRFGYLDPDGLYSLVRGWQGLYQLFKPDLVIAEAAPTALLAANVSNTRAVAIGNGFFIPPLATPFPNMRPWLEVPIARLQNSDAAALGTVNHVRQKFGCKAYGQLADIFDVKRLILSYPELDYYARGDEAIYLGNLQPEGGADPSWPEGSGKKVFVYLYAGYRFNAEILQWLAQSHASVLVYAGALEQIPAEAQAANIHYVRAPMDIYRVSVECDSVICHGGHGLVCDMLRAGKPLLLLPRHLEEFLLSAKVARMGAGIVINHEESQVDLPGALQRLLEDSSLSNSAKVFAEKYRPLTREIVKQRLADRCEKLAG